MPMPAEDAYWRIGGNPTQVWSSARRAYVPVDNPAYLAWLATGRTAIDIISEAELSKTLNNVGLGRLAPIDLQVPTENYKAMLRRRAHVGHAANGLADLGVHAEVDAVLVVDWEGHGR